MTVNAKNQITNAGFSYAAAGNTLTDGANTYTWDGESQMKSAGGVNYLYDGDGRRASKSSGKLYWYGSGGEILAETNAAGAVTAEYIFFGGKRIAMLPAGSTAQFFAEDFLGSSRVITTNTGAVCYDADFYPYGGERTLTNTCTQNAYKFEGKERDAETGNDDFGARYYSSRFGRWLSADWSSIPVPVPYANLTNPQTLNLYAMVSDDPESFADLDGHLQFSPANSPCSQEHQTECNNAQQNACAGQNTARCNTSTRGTIVEDTYNGQSVTKIYTETITNHFDEQGNNTSTTVTQTNVYFSNEQGHEGQFLGGAQSATTFDYAHGDTASNTTAALDLKGAIGAVGGGAVKVAQKIATEPNRAAYFGRAVAADIKAHPWRYVTHAAGLALPFTGVPVAAEGIITAGEALITAYDLQKEAHNP